MFRDRDLRSANIALAIAAVLMVIGVAIVGRDPTGVERQLVVWVPFGVAMATLFWLGGRRNSARERAERDSR